MIRVTILNGPNLNLLGQREPEIYGHTTMQDIESALRKRVVDEPVEIDFFQTNIEHELVEKIQVLMNQEDEYIIINPAAFTHTSIAIRDALLATKTPFIEVHLSNIHAREEFRKKSWFADIAIGTISGLGANSYYLALEHILSIIHNRDILV